MPVWIGLLSLPLGHTLPVEHNQTLIRLVQDDLDRQMDRLLLDKKQFIQRKEVGSPSAILLGIKERELSSISELAKSEKVSGYSFELVENEVQRLRNQVQLEKLGNIHFLENFELSLATLNAEINKRSVRSPIKGDFSSCFVAHW